MSRRISYVLVVLVAVEIGVFYQENRDVVMMRRPAAELVLDPRFLDGARAVLARDQVSRRVLERVADVAQRRQALALHIEVLARIVSEAPDDADARLRLAQALRSGGRLDEAEQIYRDELGHVSSGADQ